MKEKHLIGIIIAIFFIDQALKFYIKLNYHIGEVVRGRLEVQSLGLIGGLVLGVGDQATHHRDRLFARRAIEDVAGQIGRDDGFGLGGLAHVNS